MFIIYDLIFLIFAVIYLPIYLFKGKFHPGFMMRLGMLPGDIGLKQPIWIHAVSVGEIITARQLIEELRIVYPEKRFFISTVTPTGNKIAKGIAKERDFVAYLPLDISFIAKSVVNKIRPSLFVAMETEIWPNLISCLHSRNIPFLVVNGRISDHSFKGYMSIRLLLKPILDKINLFCVQTPTDAERLMRLGVLEDRIKITGNMKFDVQVSSDSKKDYADYKAKLGLHPYENFIVAGSTHAAEEEIILDAYKELLSEFPQLKLLIAPRHPERAKQIDKIVSGLGFRTIFISGLPIKPCNCLTKPVFILDEIGKLLDFYNIADIVFIGGSLVKKGGHNILEAAALGKPVIFGQYMFNFRDIAGLFLKNNAGIRVLNKEELKIAIRELLNNPQETAELGQRAKALIGQNQGATARNLEYIKSYLGAHGNPQGLLGEG